MILKACEWGESDLNLFSALSKSAAFNGKQVAAKRRAAEAQEPPDEYILKTVVAQPLFEVAKPLEPAWVSAVAYNREYFRNCAFFIDRGEGQVEAVKFIFAVQNPLYVGFGRINAMETWTSLGPVTGDNLEALASDGRRAFHTDLFDLIPSSYFADVPADCIAVLPHLEYADGCKMTTWAVHAETLTDFLATLPPIKRKHREGTSSSAGTHRAAPRTVPQWAQERLAIAAQQTRLDDSVPESPEDSNDEEGVMLPLEDEDVETLFAELELQRAAYGAADHPRDDDFKVVLFSSREAMSRGVAVQAYKGECSGLFAEVFCRERGMRMSAEFHTSTYSEQACGVLARAWCHRMQHFLNQSLPRGSRVIFAQADFEAYREPDELSELATEAANDRVLQRRVAQIRNLFVP